MKTMSRTHKIDRTRTAHARSKAWVRAFNAAHDESAAPQQRRQAQEELDRLEAQRPASADELVRTGVRYGNQRKIRSRMHVLRRRAERKKAPDPVLDVEGDVGLEDRPASPARSRGLYWGRPVRKCR